MSDDSSKKTGDSDSHHETGTDPELSDPQITITGGNSPPKASGTDEARKALSSATNNAALDKKGIFVFTPLSLQSLNKRTF